MIGRYIKVLEKANERNTAICLLDGGMFHSFYVCLAPCKQGFIDGCRPIICLDGCWLKGRYGDQFVTAIGIDTNDCIYRIARATVGNEDKHSWTWFLQNLKKDLGINDDNHHNYSIMSDKQKGLVHAVEAKFSISEHRLCVRHLYNNFKTEHRDKGLKDALWSATRATIVDEFERCMEKIKQLDVNAYNWLASKPPQQWSKSRFDTHPKCDILVNNLCECFNKVILDARDRPILSMNEELRLKLMKRFYRRRKLFEKFLDRVCPRIIKKLILNLKFFGKYWPEPSTLKKFQVRSPNQQYIVDLDEKSCSCRRWDLNGIPCAHAIAAISHNNEELEAYIAHWYSIKMFARSYAPEVDCVNGPNMWPKSSLVPLPPPLKKKRAGRPKKKRRMDADEVASVKAAKSNK